MNNTELWDNVHVQALIDWIIYWNAIFITSGTWFPNNILVNTKTNPFQLFEKYLYETIYLNNISKSPVHAVFF